MLSGLPEINIEDWKAFTEYLGYDTDTPLIKVSNKRPFRPLVKKCRSSCQSCRDRRAFTKYLHMIQPNFQDHQ